MVLHNDIFERFWERKKRRDGRSEFMLFLTIYSAEGIDPPTRYPSAAVEMRYYKAIAWINPGDEFATNVARGIFNPEWNERFYIPLGRYVDFKSIDVLNKFLKVEVVRATNTCDPAPSSGEVLVGRAQISLPKEENKAEGGRFWLVRLEGDGCKPEGQIAVSMEIKRD